MLNLNGDSFINGVFLGDNTSALEGILRSNVVGNVVRIIQRSWNIDWDINIAVFKLLVGFRKGYLFSFIDHIVIDYFLIDFCKELLLSDFIISHFFFLIDLWDIISLIIRWNDNDWLIFPG